MINLRYFPLFIYLLLLVAGCGGGSGDGNSSSNGSSNGNNPPPASVNNPPSLTLSQALNVAENASLVGEIAFSDADGDAVSLSIEGVDSESFYIDASNQLRFIFSPDYEDAKDIGGDNFFEIEIIASDGKDNDRQSVLVGILNLPENKFDELAIENLKME